MIGKNDRQKQDELSQAIDALNAGQELKTNIDSETKELLAVASLLKKAGIPSDGQRAAIESVVREIVAETGRRRKKDSRFWVYSGSAAVAAALLVFTLNIAPTPFGGQEIARVPAQNGAGAQAPALPPGPVARFIIPEVEPDRTSNPSQPAPKASAELPDRKAAQTPKPEAQIAKAPQVATPVAEKSPDVVKSDRATVEQKTAKAVGGFKLPGRTADLVTVEEQSGTVRKVYGRGTPEEITVTQAPEKPQAGVMAMRTMKQEDGESDKKQPAAGNEQTESEKKQTVSEKRQSVSEQQPPINSATADQSQRGLKRNRVTVSVGGKEVTVEGAMPEAELKKIAESLEPEEQ